MKAAAQACTEDAIATLKNALTAVDAPWAARVRAANALLDRGWGKPKESVDHTVRGPTLEELVLESYKPRDQGDKVGEAEKLH